MQRLHPLHTPEWLHRVTLDTGCYPDSTRCTGRTTAIALKTLAQAIENPHKVIAIQDHHDTVFSSREVMYMMRKLADVLDLKHLHWTANNTVTFTRK